MPITFAKIGAVAALIKLDRNAADEIWDRRLWSFASGHYVDHDRGGWFPEIDEVGQPTGTIFAGKPEIYHAIRACLFPLTDGLSRHAEALRRVTLTGGQSVSKQTRARQAALGQKRSAERRFARGRNVTGPVTAAMHRVHIGVPLHRRFLHNW